MKQLDDAGLEAATAESVLRRIDGPAARLVRAEVAALEHRVIRETTDALYRVRLHGFGAGGADVARTVIVKRMRADSPNRDPHREAFLPSSEPAHPNYWRREFEAYASPLLSALPAPLRTPRCYARELGPRTATLWLEALESEPANAWSEARFGAIARALGQWQSEHARTFAARDEPHWLARGSLRMWAPAPGSPAFAALTRPELWTSARAEAAFGRGALERVRAGWEAREATLDALERWPQTLCHNDLWTRNLLASARDAEVVAIDWSEFGIGPLAHDLVNLVLDSVWMLDVSPLRLASLERTVLESYAEGRRTSNVRALARAYRASARLRFGALAGTLLAQAADDAKRDEIAERYGRPFETVFEARAAVVRAALGNGYSG